MRISEHIKKAEECAETIDLADPTGLNPVSGLLHVLISQAKLERSRLSWLRKPPQEPAE